MQYRDVRSIQIKVLLLGSDNVERSVDLIGIKTGVSSTNAKLSIVDHIR
jgi:hypothetical protein